MQSFPNSDDPVERKLYATLRYVEEGLPSDLKPLLYPIGLHVGYVSAELLVDMADNSDQVFTVLQTQKVLGLLEYAGLVQGIGNNNFWLHPALSRYLRLRAGNEAGDERAQAWQRGFVCVMMFVAVPLTRLALNKQQSILALFGGCVEQARRLAEVHHNVEAYGALTQLLGAYAMNRHNPSLAQEYYRALVQHWETHKVELAVAAAYHELGRALEVQRNFEAAETCYSKSLEINERLGNEQGAKTTYYHLSNMAQMRHDVDKAEKWRQKLLETSEPPGDELSAARRYNLLSRVAQEQRDFKMAKVEGDKSLEISKVLGDELGMAITYHNFGILAQEERDFKQAKDWYNKSLKITEQQGYDFEAATTYFNLNP